MPLHTENAPDPFLSEILGQPGAVRAAAAGLLEQTTVLGRLGTLLEGASRPLVLTGMGSSYDALLGLSSLLGRAGHQTLTINTAELVNFQMAMVESGAVVIAVSQSGRSAEVVRLAAELPTDSDATLVSVTNGLANPLAEAAHLQLDMRAGDEHGPATMTFVATLVVLAAIAGVVDTGASPVDLARQVAREAGLAADELERTLLDYVALAESMDAWAAGRSSIAIVGRGVGLVTAELGALVLKEAAQNPALSMDAAEFRHGPLELAGPELAVAVISLEPTTLGFDRRLLTDLRARDSRVLAVGLPDPAIDVWRLPVLTPQPLLAAAVAAVPLQLLAWRLASARHRVPGQFTVGSKVTTEE